MILNIVLISVIVVLTAGMIAAFAVDYKRAKAGNEFRIRFLKKAA